MFQADGYAQPFCSNDIIPLMGNSPSKRVALFRAYYQLQVGAKVKWIGLRFASALEGKAFTSKIPYNFYGGVK